MSNVYTTILGVPKRSRNGRVYANGSSFNSTTVQSSEGQSVVTPKDIITFTSTDTPTITAYNTTWAATHGQYPSVRCMIVVDATTEYELQQMPQFTKVGGLIDTIFFLPGDTYTGYLILY